MYELTAKVTAKITVRLYFRRLDDRLPKRLKSMHYAGFAVQAETRAAGMVGTLPRLFIRRNMRNFRATSMHTCMVISFLIRLESTYRPDYLTHSHAVTPPNHIHSVNISLVSPGALQDLQSSVQWTRKQVQTDISTVKQLTMGFKIASLWQAPAINPVNNKAQSIPFLNPFNIYGRVFLLSWWSFFVAFWSWYAFPPLLTVTIKADLHLTQNQIANSNILALVATLIVRLSAGAACDRFGPRWTFAAILITGAIPTALAGTVNSATGLIILRLFVGILGGAFVPCQVWTTGFFDKNVVGTANALAAGLGNAGSGVTYFLMPAIFDSLVQRQHLKPHVAWRVAFVVPFVFIIVTALMIIIACPDAPTGKWSTRAFDMQRQAEHRG